MASVREMGGEGDGPEPGVGLRSAISRREEASGQEGANFVIIKEIYESEDANELFEQQLEQALANKEETIIIEPNKLGDETSRWISVGNCLHKTAVITGAASILSGFVWPDKPLLYLPATMASVLCTSVYSLCWQFDPCCKYQVETDAKRLEELIRPAIRTIRSTSPIVLVRKDDTRRKILHYAVTSACLSQTLLKLYFPYISSGFGRITSKLFASQKPEAPPNQMLLLSGFEGSVPTVPPPIFPTSIFMQNGIGPGSNRP